MRSGEISSIICLISIEFLEYPSIFQVRHLSFGEDEFKLNAGSVATVKTVLSSFAVALAALSDSNSLNG